MSHIPLIDPPPLPAAWRAVRPGDHVDRIRNILCSAGRAPLRTPCRGRSALHGVTTGSSGERRVRRVSQNIRTCRQAGFGPSTADEGRRPHL